MNDSTDLILDELPAGKLRGYDRLLRQARLLAQSDLSSIHLGIPSGIDDDVSTLAKAMGIVVSRVSSESAVAVSREWSARGLSVSVVVASHNYGHYLDEAVNSVLAQTYLPDQIILSDDASSDDSAEKMRRLAAANPELMIVNVNTENLGIDKHFNLAASLATGEVIMFLGADNRIPPHYIEACLAALVSDPEVAIAYTDFALFGSRASMVHDSLREDFRGAKLDYGVRLSNFPEFNDASRSILDDGVNFIHGSSLYRRSAFEQVGGYGSRDDGPEDMQLFQSMISQGWSARKVPGVFLEYRQHSSDQANMQFSLYRELHRLRGEITEHKRHFESLRDENDHLRRYVNRIRTSIPFKILMLLSFPYRALRKRFR